jgi:hypothetical protein
MARAAVHGQLAPTGAERPVVLHRCHRRLTPGGAVGDGLDGQRIDHVVQVNQIRPCVRDQGAESRHLARVGGVQARDSLDRAGSEGGTVVAPDPEA